MGSNTRVCVSMYDPRRALRSYPRSRVFRLVSSARWPFLHCPVAIIHRGFIVRCYRRRCPAATPQACTTQSCTRSLGSSWTILTPLTGKISPGPEDGTGAPRSRGRQATRPSLPYRWTSSSPRSESSVHPPDDRGPDFIGAPALCVQRYIGYFLVVWCLLRVVVLGRLGRTPSPHPRACALSCPSPAIIGGLASFGRRRA